MTSRPVGWFSFVMVSLVATGGFYAGFRQAEGRLLNLTIATFMASAAVMAVTSLRSPRNQWRTADLQGRPAWTLRVGHAGGLPSVALVLTTLGVGLGLGAVSVDSVGLAVVVGLLALFILVLAAELWRAWFRRPELRISADLIQFHGTGIDSELGWDDVELVRHEHLGTRWAALVCVAVPGAPSYRYRLRRFLLPTDRVPDPPGIHLRVGLIPDERHLRRLLQAMHGGGRPVREAMISRGLPEASGY